MLYPCIMQGCNITRPICLLLHRSRSSGDRLRRARTPPDRQYLCALCCNCRKDCLLSSDRDRPRGQSRRQYLLGCCPCVEHCVLGPAVDVVNHSPENHRGACQNNFQCLHLLYCIAGCRPDLQVRCVMRSIQWKYLATYKGCSGS